MFRVTVGAAFALLLVSASAFADEASARKTYDAGERAYNLGDFEKAVALFKQAYEDWPEPAFLFNIAQTYRQAGDCKQAVFFYKRFLSLKQTDSKKPIKPELQKEVEARIVELEECMRRELASRPPDSLDNGRTATTTTPTTATVANATNPTTQPTTTTAQVEGQTDESEQEEPQPAANQQASVISARLDGGVGMFKAGDIATTQVSGALIGGYPLSLGDKLQLELGAAFSFLPVPYKTTSGESGTGTLLAVLANVAPSYTLIPKLAARLDVGVGAQIFSGLDKAGNPFTMSGAVATGPLTVFHVRAAVSADYAVTPNVVVTVTPFAFAYSPAPAGFQSATSSLTTMSFMAGVGFRK